MSGKEIFEKGMLSIVGAWISNKLGILLPCLLYTSDAADEL